MENEHISIRAIQHFLYCPHRWGLIEINRSWAENFFVTKGNLVHERVHEKGEYSLRGRKSHKSVSVYHDPLGIYGVLDIVEEIPNKSVSRGSIVQESRFCIVEYKPTQPKDKEYNDEDMFQVFVQKICLDYTINTDSDACLYYADVRKRVYLPLKELYPVLMKRLEDALLKIKLHLEAGIIPPIPKGQNCSGCSLKDMCIPKLKKIESVTSILRKK